MAYTAVTALIIVVALGCFFGVRLMVRAVSHNMQTKEASRQQAIEESLTAESLAAEEAVARMLQLDGEETEPQSEPQELSEGVSQEEALEELVLESICSLTLEQKVAGLFFVTPEQLTGVGQVVQAGDSTKEALTKYPVGGLFYSSANIKSREQLEEMLSNTVSYSAFPLFLAVEEEGGDKSPVADALGLGRAAGAKELGESQDTQAACEAGQTIGNDLASCGFNLDFAPVADVRLSEDSIMKDRAFSDDPKAVAQMVSAAVSGIQESGVSACLKYFPGQGSATEDPAQGMAETNRTKEEMQQAEFVPFQAGIEAGCDMIMVGNITAPALSKEESVPAGLSEEIITGILRNELGYDGVILTDRLDVPAVTEYYESDVAAIMALKAGADMVLAPENFEQAYQGVLKAVQDGTISQERVEDSLARIYRIKLRGRIFTE